MTYKKKKNINPEVSKYFSELGKKGYKAKVKKIISSKVEVSNSNLG